MMTVDDVRACLKRAETKLSRAKIAEECGVNRHWLEKFSQGVIANPSYRNVTMVSEWLARHSCEANGRAA